MKKFSFISGAIGLLLSLIFMEIIFQKKYDFVKILCVIFLICHIVKTKQI